MHGLTNCVVLTDPVPRRHVLLADPVSRWRVLLVDFCRTHTSLSCLTMVHGPCWAIMLAVLHCLSWRFKVEEGTKEK